MSDTRDARSVVDAAEQAAAAGDYGAAEHLLREAAPLQEASLGPLHPELANTLNNLGVVCEITEKLADAEHYFRRACAIATAVLEPDHPFVATSRRNLEDFCTARGKNVDSPSATSSADDRHAPATGSDDLPPERPSYEESRPAVSRRRTPPLAIGALIAAGLAFIATATWLRSNDEVESSRGSSNVSAGSPATTAVSPPARPIAPEVSREIRTGSGSAVGVESETGAAASTTTAAGRVRESSPLPGAAAASRNTAPAELHPPVVAAAQLCSDFSTNGPRDPSGDWHCVPPSRPIRPGALVFYTRLKSPIVTAVQHRWYRGDHLRQVVELRIRPNTTGGYRTYSRNTVDSQGAGDWRVELRTTDGVLLHEERFVVR